MKRSLDLVFLLARNKVAAPMQDSQTGGRGGLKWKNACNVIIVPAVPTKSTNQRVKHADKKFLLSSAIMWKGSAHLNITHIYIFSQWVFYFYPLAVCFSFIHEWGSCVKLVFCYKLPWPFIRAITASLKPKHHHPRTSLTSSRKSWFRARHSFAWLTRPRLQTHCLLFLPGSGARRLPRMTLAADVAGPRKNKLADDDAVRRS